MPSDSHEQLFRAILSIFRLGGLDDEKTTSCEEKKRKKRKRKRVCFVSRGHSHYVIILQRVQLAVDPSRRVYLHTAYYCTYLTTGQLDSSIIHRLSISLSMQTMVVKKCKGFLTANPFTIPKEPQHDNCSASLTKASPLIDPEHLPCAGYHTTNVLVIPAPSLTLITKKKNRPTLRVACGACYPVLVCSLM